MNKWIKILVIDLLAGLIVLYAGIYWGYGHYGIKTNIFNLWVKPLIIFGMGYCIIRVLWEISGKN